MVSNIESALMSDKPILFFSPKCKHSIQLWRYLKDKNILSEVNKVNISTCSRIPAAIKSVPTLIVKNRPPIIGDAIKFYFNTTTTVSSAPSTSTRARSQASNGNPTPETQAGPIRDFMPGEMGNGWSDNYSFLQDSKPIDHSFCFLDQKGEQLATLTETSKQFQNNQSTRKKKNNLNERLEEYKKNRRM